MDRAAEIVRAQGDRYSAARVALTRLSHELTEAFLSDHYDRNEHRERPTLFRGREDELLFATMANERLYLDAKESDQAVVEYVLDADPDHAGEEALFRRAKPRIDADPSAAGAASSWPTGSVPARLLGPEAQGVGARVVDARDRARERAARARADRARDDAPRRSHREALDGGADRDHATARLLMRARNAAGRGRGGERERRSSS